MNTCQCGCGRETRIAPANNTARQWVKGAPVPFVRGHRISPKRTVDRKGYVWLYRPEHPHANTSGYVQEHRLVAEAALGRALARRHPVHHVDRNPSSNASSNLVVCEDQAYHMLLHQRQRALDACGHADWMPCAHCGEYDDPALMYVYGASARHRRCHAAYELEHRPARAGRTA